MRFKNSEVEDDQSESQSAVKKVGKGFLKIGVALLIMFVVLVIGTTIMKSMSLNQLRSASESLDNANNWFQYIRWAFIAAFIYWWKPINTWLANKNQWNTNQLNLVLSMRWIALFVLVFVELIFIQRVYEWVIW